LKKISRLGGALSAVEKGFFQDEIRRNAYQLKKDTDEHKRIIVGVNQFQDAADSEPHLNAMDPEIEKKQIARLRDFKTSRDRIKVGQALEALQRAAENTEENLMPHILYAVKSYVTLGEISNTLREVFGKYEPKVSF
jgi:methylmalonyl-CoA mutase, N-terminal domain